MSRGEVEAAVVSFVAAELRVERRRVTPNARLTQDLGVDGADGWELIEAFGERFTVDLSAFAPSLHFGPEAGPNPFVWLYWLARPSARPRSVPITVEDLTAAAERGTWVTPVAPAI